MRDRRTHIQVIRDIMEGKNKKDEVITDTPSIEDSDDDNITVSPHAAGCTCKKCLKAKTEKMRKIIDNA